MRLPKIAEEDFNDKQRELSARIAGKRGKVRGPYLCWLHSPELCERVEALGAYVRYDCSLSEKLRELSILITARFFDAQHSWNAHAEKAIAAGISRDAVMAMAEHRKPVFAQRDEQVFYEFCQQLLTHHFVDRETYAEAEEIFGRQGLVDTIGCLGNFSMLAFCLNAFEVDLDPLLPPPFADVRGYAKVGNGDER
jgi:4-carboxymuconolactone decarboxylase